MLKVKLNTYSIGTDGRRFARCSYERCDEKGYLTENPDDGTMTTPPYDWYIVGFWGTDYPRTYHAYNCMRLGEAAIERKARRL